ncbi:MAG: hypothetical protein HY663_06680 [Chloroflexi bacterium]|nr:hypothetical protein [Chloroflexota bacterium]
MADLFSYTGKVLDIDLTTEKITKIPSSKYFPKFLGGRGLIAKVLWDDVPPGTPALDPENRLVFAPGTLTGTNSPTNGRSEVGALAPQHPKEYPSYSNMGGHWGAELKFAGYDGLIIHGAAKKPVYILIRDEEVEIRDAAFLWGQDALVTQKMIQEALAKEGTRAPDLDRLVKQENYNPLDIRSARDIPIPNMREKSQGGRYDARRVRSMAIGPAGEKQSRIAIILHDSGDAAGQGGFGGVMGSKKLKAVAIRGTNKLHVAKPQEMVELAYKIRRLIREKALPIIPAYGGPGGIYGGDPKILTGHMIRTDGCFGCQIACRAYIAPPGMTPGQQQCVALQMYYNWEGIGPVAPLTPEFANRKQDETTWYGVKLADETGINSYELTGILSWLWAAYKEGILNEQNTGLSFNNFGSKEFADKLFGMIANREGEFGNLLAEGLHRAAEKLREQYGNRIWELYEERYTAHGSRQHWFYIGSAKGPGDPTGYPNPIGQLLWATGTRDPYSDTSKNRETTGDPELSKYMYGTEKASNPFNYDGKAQAAIVAQHQTIVIDSLGFCDWFFPIQRPPLFFADKKDEKALGDKTLESQMYSLATGIDTPYEKMMKNAERIFNLERAIQVRIGRRREDDTFNEYYFKNLDRRGNPIDRNAWEKAKDEYYQIRGWDPKTGIPTRQRLEELDLKDVADALKL